MRSAAPLSIRHLPITAARAMTMPILPADAPNASATREIFSAQLARRQQADQHRRGDQRDEGVDPQHDDHADDRHDADQQNHQRIQHRFTQGSTAGKSDARVQSLSRHTGCNASLLLLRQREALEEPAVGFG